MVVVAVLGACLALAVLIVVVLAAFRVSRTFLMALRGETPAQIAAKQEYVSSPEAFQGLLDSDLIAPGTSSLSDDQRRDYLIQRGWLDSPFVIAPGYLPHYSYATSQLMYSTNASNALLSTVTKMPTDPGKDPLPVEMVLYVLNYLDPECLLHELWKLLVAHKVSFLDPNHIVVATADTPEWAHTFTNEGEFIAHVTSFPLTDQERAAADAHLKELRDLVDDTFRLFSIAAAPATESSVTNTQAALGAISLLGGIAWWEHHKH